MPLCATPVLFLTFNLVFKVNGNNSTFPDIVFPPAPTIVGTPPSGVSSIASDGFGSVYIPKALNDGDCVNVTYNITNNDNNVTFQFRDHALLKGHTVLDTPRPPQKADPDFGDETTNGTSVTFNWKKHAGTNYRVFRLDFERDENNTGVVTSHIFSIDPKIVNQ